ncbi:hypothetical protein BZA05DRAFT_409518 [Tricharina praecox]|uniref:uncharacterized protein n=1 Tax=Tricharina praecox TaxID=43433 RepID=UPI00221EFA54|nr:uncharacterized protein BZA05DRAFT_409518 [Tricharina praecox]KAI5844245.1 hypothetical protein BZA05DRAFT_409518 [Tricharina praecox]
MQFLTTLLSTLTFASVASAHYALTYPAWRGDSFATQWNYPCGGVNTTSTSNRTLWPLDGGAVAFKPGHPWAQTYINLGLGNNVTRFNITLAAPFNQTSNGTFCFPDMRLPEGVNVQEGDIGSIQVVQLTTSGGALYNCADITFSKNATDPSTDVCFNSTGVGASVLDYDGAAAAAASGSGAANSTSAATQVVGVAYGAGSVVLVAAAAVAVLMV